MTADRFSRAVLGGAALLCLLTLLYLATTAGPEGVRSSWALVLGLAAAGLVASLWLPRLVRVQLAATGLALVAALYAAEFYLASAAEGASPQQRAAEAAGTPFDGRSKLEVVQALRAEGEPAYPAVHGRLVRLERSDRLPMEIRVRGEKRLPVSGPSDQRIVVCNELGEYLTYRSDRFGFHNPPGAWEMERPDFAAVGDSFTHGACVPSGEGLVARLREGGTTALNLGLDGNGPLAMLAAIREYLPPVQPRTVLWVYYEVNDLADLEEEKGNPVLASYLRPDFRQGLRDDQPEISRQLVEFLERALREEARTARLERLKLSQLRTALGLRGFNPIEGARPADPDACCDVETLARALELARDEVRGWGGELYFVYLPGWRRVAAAEEMEAPERAREQVLQTATRLGIPVVDVAAAFARHPDPAALFAYPGPYSHYNAAGYALAAQSIRAASGR